MKFIVGQTDEYFGFTVPVSGVSKHELQLGKEWTLE